MGIRLGEMSSKCNVIEEKRNTSFKLYSKLLAVVLATPCRLGSLGKTERGNIERYKTTNCMLLPFGWRRAEEEKGSITGL